jgi:hypothetical protein
VVAFQQQGAANNFSIACATHKGANDQTSKCPLDMLLIFTIIWSSDLQYIASLKYENTGAGVVEDDVLDVEQTGYVWV